MHGLDFNIEVTGFEMGEIDLRIASLDEPPERDDDPADALPKLADGAGTLSPYALRAQPVLLAQRDRHRVAAARRAQIDLLARDPRIAFTAEPIVRLTHRWRRQSRANPSRKHEPSGKLQLRWNFGRFWCR